VIIDREQTTRAAMAGIRADLWRSIAEMNAQTNPDLEWFGEDDLIRLLYCYKAYRMLLSEVIQHKRELAAVS
jgi:hypothetical protein